MKAALAMALVASVLLAGCRGAHEPTRDGARQAILASTGTAIELTRRLNR